MINNKNPLNQAGIIDWIYNNLYIFSPQPLRAGQNLKEEKDKFGKALLSLKKYLSFHVKSEKPGVKLSKIGTIYGIESCANNIKKSITKIRYSSDFLIKFTQIEPKKHGPIKCQQLDYQEIAGEIFLEPQFVKFAIDSYFTACLQLALLEQDRKVILDLGVGKIQILNRKVRLRQVSRINENKQNVSIFGKHMTKKNENAQQIWKESLEGTIYQHLNIKRIKQNFDKGASTTYKYNQLINKQYF